MMNRYKVTSMYYVYANNEKEINTILGDLINSEYYSYHAILPSNNKDTDAQCFKVQIIYYIYANNQFEADDIVMDNLINEYYSHYNIEFDILSFNDYRLTEKGIKECERYISECKAKRKEILDARLDSADDTILPTVKDIENEIGDYIDEDGEYYNSWGVTNNYSADEPIHLTIGEDFIGI